MKNLYTLIFLLPGIYFAQLSTPQGQIQSTTNPEFKHVGIGTNTPQAILDIHANENIPIIRGNGGYIPTGLRFIDDAYTQPGQVKEWAIWKGNTWAKGLGFYRYDAVNRCEGGICDISLFLQDNGNIGIGYEAPQYKLDVNGSARFHDMISGGLNSWIFHSPDDGRTTLHIAPKNNTSEWNWDWDKQFVINGVNGNVRVSGKLEAKEIKVTSIPTADFVFENSYKLPDLDSVEKHIKEKKHLPEIASAVEMQKEGVNVGEFQIKLLQKIEELTLYVIEQNKKIQQLEKAKNIN
ncbi:hypothetical protein KRE47_17585 [Elizabethkingia meningoseptica]|uniref:hypothetical protein n=1 Tax=Elizabethkingia meningoseptica TaxID=238 RepID=UPI0022F1BC10|nr:hypothetical protein [Elizabethkingia meningoseptica]EJK5330792.1 hypothetical protein [Elizabethkingia meningoseptica]MDE5469837.1 hypothetical protein [Elizabethkingia meningoseptica]MDE5476755.1 hypothetical protein [Elizabethkingia meningoseptica]MDE5480189.1 hypothetical protein [Elizabethkingia meningoseptica]MDE5486926.1 hypothetical protein [Elizabethkingia meningoseptica]